MKNINIKLFCLVALFALGSCKKDFLEQSNPDALNISKSFKTENDVLLAVNGCYALLRSGNTIGEAVICGPTSALMIPVQMTINQTPANLLGSITFH